MIFQKASNVEPNNKEVPFVTKMDQKTFNHDLTKEKSFYAL